MKSRVGILKGKKIIIGEENDLTKNEILLKPKGDKIELSVREGETIKVISGGDSGSEEELITITLNSDSNSIGNTFINKKWAIYSNSVYASDSKQAWRELPFIEDASNGQITGGNRGYYCTSTVNPYMVFYVSSASSSFRKAIIEDPKNTFINKIDRCIEWYYDNENSGSSRTKELDIVKNLDNHTVEITGMLYAFDKLSDTSIILYDKDGNVLACVGCTKGYLRNLNDYLVDNPVENAKPIDFSNTKGYLNISVR